MEITRAQVYQIRDEKGTLMDSIDITKQCELFIEADGVSYGENEAPIDEVIVDLNEAATYEQGEYILKYVKEEIDRGHTITLEIFKNAIDAFEGGAR